jgi:hypothetical protein
MDLATSAPVSTMTQHNPYHTPQSSTTPMTFSSPFKSHQTSENMHSNHHQPSQPYYPSDSPTSRPPTSTRSPPADRQLPSKDITNDQSFEDAYVTYILYCNPTISLDADTTDLRRNFAMPPRSDSKTFSTKLLFELLKKLDTKEIKTWVELALELGVEKPNVEKGQSSQKVQQYSVRLKVRSIYSKYLFLVLYLPDPL